MSLVSQLSETRAQFLAQGACCVRGAFTKEWLALVRAGIDACAAQPSKLAKVWQAEHGQGRFFQDGFAWERFEPLRRFVFESPAARIASELMGSAEIRLYMDHILVRDRNTDR